jgi:hypothetical protein
MRELTIYNYSMKPEEVLGKVRLVEGEVTITGFPPRMMTELQAGMPDANTGTRIMPDQGVVFFEAVLNRYSGAYVRAVEKTLGSILKA